LLSLEEILDIVKSCGFKLEFNSDHFKGAETVAPGVGLRE